MDRTFKVTRLHHAVFDHVWPDHLEGEEGPDYLEISCVLGEGESESKKVCVHKVLAATI